MDTNRFIAGLKNAVLAARLDTAGTWGATNPTPRRLEEVQAILLPYFASLGAGLGSPKPVVILDDRTGALVVAATDKDLHIIEQAVKALNAGPPQVHIRARFIELADAPAAAFAAQFAPSNSFPFATVRLTPSQAKRQIQLWHSMAGVKFLAEMDVTTLSGTSGSRSSLRTPRRWSTKQTPRLPVPSPQTSGLMGGQLWMSFPRYPPTGSACNLESRSASMGFSGTMTRCNLIGSRPAQATAQLLRPPPCLFPASVFVG